MSIHPKVARHGIWIPFCDFLFGSRAYMEMDPEQLEMAVIAAIRLMRETRKGWFVPGTQVRQSHDLVFNVGPHRILAVKFPIEESGFKFFEVQQ